MVTALLRSSCLIPLRTFGNDVTFGLLFWKTSVAVKSYLFLSKKEKNEKNTHKGPERQKQAGVIVTSMARAREESKND